MKWLRNICRRIARSEDGAVAVEFAVLAPAFAGIFLMFVETSYFILLNLKVQHATTAVGDLVTRDETISETGINDMFEVVEQIIQPWDIGDNSRVIVTAVSEVDDDPTVLWQRLGAGTFNAASGIGVEDGAATMPTGFVVRANETVIITELFYDYEPLLIDFLGDITLVKQVFHRPRLSTLQSVDPD